MEYRIGLDLGTHSIGAVALSLEYNTEQKQLQPVDVIWHRGHIFSEPLNNTQTGLVPKTAERREARQKRRQLQRRARRIKKIYQLASLLDLNKDGILQKNEHISLEDGTKIPYLAYIRAKAAEKKIELDDLIRVFSRLTKRRGYSGGFKTKSEKEKKGAVETGADLLKETLQNKTLGQFLFERLLEGKPTRLKISQIYKDESDLYALREHLETEFETIWKTQQQYHAILNRKAVCPVPGKYYAELLPLKKIFKIAIFDQRPLKPFNDKIGLCELEPNLPRAPKAQMVAQAFRIEKILGDLMVGQGKKTAKPLSQVQKNVIRDLLNKQAELGFETIYKALEKANCPLSKGKRFSIEYAKRESLKGNTTLAGFKSLKLLDDWLALDDLTQVQIINFWNELGSPDQLFDDRWYEKFLTWNKNPDKRKIRVFSESFKNFIDKLRRHEKFDRLSKMNHFESGRSAYSIKALKHLTEYMQAHHCNEYDAIHGNTEGKLQGCYPQLNKIENKRIEKLSAPVPTGNAVVDVALRQLQKVINDCIDNLGCPPKEIIVEMSRDIKNGVTARNEIDNQNRRREAARKKAAVDITENFHAAATPDNILKYELWTEQEHHCPYCNYLIGANEVLDGSKTNFEHIIPRSKSKVGRKRSEIILAHRRCNDIKGNRLPLLVPEFINDEQSILAIKNMAELLEKKGKRQRMPGILRKALLLRLDDEEGLLEDESVSSFSDWQLHDNSWIAKLAAQWLGCLVEKTSQVSITKGGLTAYMRRHLGLDTVIPELRYQEGKSVLTKENVSLNEEDFEQYKSFYHGHRWQGKVESLPPELDKRIDHRHHLVDAFIIALSDRKFVLRASRLHQSYCEKADKSGVRIDGRVIREKMRKAIGHNLQSFKAREKALIFLQNAHITHRPDHNLAGKFYQDAAYQKIFDEETEKFRLIIRKRISELVVIGNYDKTLKKLNSIVKPSVRDHVISVFQERINSGKKPEEAFSVPVIQKWYGKETPILSVSTYYDRGAEKADPVPYFSDYGEETKYLIPDLFAYFKLFFTDDGHIDSGNSHLVSLADHARRIVRNIDVPHPNEWRYYKGDTVMNVKTKERFVICKFKNDTSRYIFLSPLTETRNWDKISAKGSSDKHIAFTVGIKNMANYKPEYLLK